MNDVGREMARFARKRMHEIGKSGAEVAATAGVDPTTVRAFIRGVRRPHDSTLARIESALEVEPGTLARSVADRQGLDRYLTVELLEEVLRRAAEEE